MATVAVSIWPEYDRPTALVITEMLLSPSVPLPAEVTLRVPATMERVQVVAVGSTLSTVTDQGIDYSLTEGEPWSEIKITAPQRAIRVEYYDAALAKVGSQRDFTYTWPGDYAVGDFVFELRAPLESSNVSSEPRLSQDLVDSEGFQYWAARPGSLEKGDPFQVRLGYDRSSDLPSTAFMVGATQEAGPVASATWTNFVYEKLPYIIGLLGLALLIGGGWWFWRTGLEGPRALTSRRRSSAIATSRSALVAGRMRPRRVSTGV